LRKFSDDIHVFVHHVSIPNVFMKFAFAHFSFTFSLFERVQIFLFDARNKLKSRRPKAYSLVLPPEKETLVPKNRLMVNLVVLVAAGGGAPVAGSFFAPLRLAQCALCSCSTNSRRCLHHHLER
jgi:hypothetical protein